MALSCKIVVSVAVLLGRVAAFAAGPDEAAVAGLVRTGEVELKAAAIGVAGAEDRALAAFDAALAASPGHARARAGRGLALIARALNAPLAEKLPLARRGCAELDAAVAAAPHDPALRLMRATSSVQMPLLLGRRDLAERDFAVLLAAARDDRVTMAPQTRRSVFFQAAAFALKERRAGAVELLEEAVSIQAEEPTDEQVQSMLALARRQVTSLSDSHADSHPPEEAPASRP
ncbi:MAG: hypothetical protein IAE82_13170 [Opitutaceae bacterium]|nr:hypothetical protein [Opitutaceae bacterium]